MRQSPGGGAPKVLQILTRLGAGGPPLSVILTTRHLNLLGYSARLVTGRCDHVDLDMSYLLDPSDPVEWIEEMSRSVSVKNDLLALWRLYRIMRTVRPTVVQTHTAKAGMLGRVAAKLAGVPVIVHTFHGHVLKGYFSRPVSIGIRLLERLLAKFTDVICVLAPQQAEELANRFQVAPASKFRVVPLGLDLEPFLKLEPPKSVDGWLTVGWLGRFVEIKDLALLIRVMEETFARNERIRFVVAGDGEQRDLMQAAAQRYGDQRLRWLGWVKDVASVVTECDVMVQTSRNEGTPVALIQGMGAARPFVSTAAGGVVDLVAGQQLREHAGCRWFSNAVLAESNPAAFASALCHLQNQPELVTSMGQQARSFACQRHSLEALAVNYDRLYSELFAMASGEAHVAANLPLSYPR
jgi:glycosyltransferase involved in cell wall biosynthesis